MPSGPVAHRARAPTVHERRGETRHIAPDSAHKPSKKGTAVITATPINAGLPSSKMLVQLSEPVHYTVFVLQDEAGDLPAVEERRSTSYALISMAELETIDAHQLRRITRETAIFPADEDGNVLDWAELAAISGVADHGVAARAAGWKLMEPTSRMQPA